MTKQILAALLGVALTTAASAETLRVGLEAAYEPFAYKNEQGELVGFDVEIAEALCAQMDVTCEFVEQDWKGIIPALNTRKYDAIISSMSITEERKKAVDFTQKYYQTPSVLVARADSGIDGAAGSLAGKRIGVLKASTQERYALKAYAGAEVVAYDSTQQVYLDLVAGRLDATVADSVEVSVGFLGKPEGEGFAFVGGPIKDDVIFGAGAGIAVRKGEQALRERLDRAIEAIRANGTYAAINARYFDFDIYGG